MALIVFLNLCAAYYLFAVDARMSDVPRLDRHSYDSRHREAPSPRDAETLDARDVFARDLDLHRGLEGERVHVHGDTQDCHLGGSEVRALGTIGTFRVGDVRHGHLEWVRSAELIRAVVSLDDGDRTVINTVPERDREFLETAYASTIKSYGDNLERHVLSLLGHRPINNSVVATPGS